MSAPSETPSTNPDLESFREQWRAEVRARVPGGGGGGGGSSTQQPHRHRHRATSSVAAHPTSQPPPPTHKPPVLKDYEDDYVQPRSFDEAVVEAAGGDDGEVKVAGKEPVSALEHYEKAVERESAGSLGDSLRLYRKAFRVSWWCMSWDLWDYANNCLSRWMIGLIRCIGISTFLRLLLRRQLRRGWLRLL